MSRSYKRHPAFHNNFKSAKVNKKLANRKIRRKMRQGEFLTQNGGYRRLSNSWDIHDYDSFYPASRAEQDFYFYKLTHSKYSSFKEYLDKYWAKYYHRK